MPLHDGGAAGGGVVKESTEHADADTAEDEEKNNKKERGAVKSEVSKGRDNVDEVVVNYVFKWRRHRYRAISLLLLSSGVSIREKALGTDENVYYKVSPYKINNGARNKSTPR
jgi:hypothetical protein